MKAKIDIPKPVPLSGKELGLGDQLPLSFGKGGGFLTEEDELEREGEEEEDYEEVGEPLECGHRFGQGRGWGHGRGRFEQREEADLDTAGQGDWVGVLWGK